jgi:flavin reductase (DIM6/NTAB) family NADH-FMN oxidoreductase RutF
MCHEGDNGMQFDPQLVERQSIYKLLIGCVVPRPIAWVSSLSEEAIANVAPFSFFMAVCNDPPTLAFSSGRREGSKKDRPRSPRRPSHLDNDRENT